MVTVSIEELNLNDIVKSISTPESISILETELTSIINKNSKVGIYLLIVDDILTKSTVPVPFKSNEEYKKLIEKCNSKNDNLPTAGNSQIDNLPTAGNRSEIVIFSAFKSYYQILGELYNETDSASNSFFEIRYNGAKRFKINSLIYSCNEKDSNSIKISEQTKITLLQYFFYYGKLHETGEPTLSFKISILNKSEALKFILRHSLKKSNSVLFIFLIHLLNICNYLSDGDVFYLSTVNITQVYESEIYRHFIKNIVDDSENWDLTRKDMQHKYLGIFLLSVLNSLIITAQKEPQNSKNEFSIEVVKKLGPILVMNKYYKPILTTIAKELDRLSMMAVLYFGRRPEDHGVSWYAEFYQESFQYYRSSIYAGIDDDEFDNVQDALDKVIENEIRKEHEENDLERERSKIKKARLA